MEDGDLSVALWVRVDECQPTGRGGVFLWHAQVVTADDGWSNMVVRTIT